MSHSPSRRLFGRTTNLSDRKLGALSSEGADTGVGEAQPGGVRHRQGFVSLRVLSRQKRSFCSSVRPVQAGEGGPSLEGRNGGKKRETVVVGDGDRHRMMKWRAQPLHHRSVASAAG